MNRWPDMDQASDTPFPAILLEAVGSALLAVVLLLSLAMEQERSGRWSHPVSQESLEPRPKEKPAPELLAPLTVTEWNNLSGHLMTRMMAHEEHMANLLDRIVLKVETLASPSGTEGFVPTMNKLDHQISELVQMTKRVADRTSVEQLQEKVTHFPTRLQRKHDLIANVRPKPKLKPNLGLPQYAPPPTSPTSSVEVSHSEAIISPSIPETIQSLPTQAPNLFFSRLLELLSRRQIQAHLGSEPGTLQLAMGFNFEPGSMETSEGQKSLLRNLAHALMEILPCHTAKAELNFSCPVPSGNPSIDSIRVIGHAPFAHPGEARFYSNWNLASGRAYKALHTMLQVQPDLMKLTNRRDQTLFKIAGRVKDADPTRRSHYLDLHFTFE